MTKRIIYQNEEGGITVMISSDNAGPPLKEIVENLVWTDEEEAGLHLLTPQEVSAAFDVKITKAVADSRYTVEQIAATDEASLKTSINAILESE